MTRQAVADALLPSNLWATFGRDLLDAMPDKFREEIGRKAIEGASYIGQLETINTSRVARGEKPLTMTQFMAGSEADEDEESHPEERQRPAQDTERSAAAEEDWIWFAQIDDSEGNYKFEQRMTRSQPVRFQHRRAGDTDWVEGRPGASD